MFKGVHLLTPRPNMLISLIDQFTIFNGWMDSRADPGVDRGFFVSVCVGGGGPGPTARIQDPHMGTLHTYVRYISIYIYTYACTDRHMNVHAQADGWTYMYMYRRQTKTQVI